MDQEKQALEILREAGIPVDGLSKRRQGHLARVFLCLAALKPGDPWCNVRDASTWTLTTKGILKFGREHLDENRSDGSYDDVRRQDLKLPVAAGLVTAAANKLSANTNDSTRGYGLHVEFANLVRTYGSDDWVAALESFRAKWPSIAAELERKREVRRIPITIRPGEVIQFEPDAHNVLQKALIENFLPIFGFGAQLLYVGDAADREKYRDKELLDEIGVFELKHEKLPDVIAYSRERNWLFLIEAVTTSNPVTEIRRLTLERMLEEKCSADRIYVSAFLDRETFKRFASDIAWETEVWIAAAPEHMAHFNGDKFLGPYKSASDQKKESDS